MNVRNFLYMKLTGKVLPFANIEDILLAQKLGEAIKTITGNPLNFLTKKAQKAISTKISFAPIQDLHGYDYPWPAGGGKNIFNKDSSNIETNKRIAVSTGGTYDSNGYSVSDYIPIELAERYSLTISSGFTSYYAGYDANKQYISTPTNTWNSGTSKILSATGYAYVRFDFKTSDIDAVQFEKGYASAYAPYSNISPISGRTNVSLKGCGKNQHNGEVYIPNKYIGSSGNLVASNNYNVYKLNDVSAGEYTLSVYDNTEELLNIVLCAQGFDDNDRQTFLNYTTHPSSKSRESITFTVPSGTSYVLYCFRITDYDVQAETGSSATTYESYQQSNDITISFGETVYGGTLDVETGELVVGNKYIDFSTVTINKNNNDPNNWNYYIRHSSLSYSSNMICSHLVYKSTIPTTSIGLSSRPTNRAIYMNFLDAIGTNNVSHFRQYCVDNNVQLVCELATPITIQLTPSEVQLLKGVNNLWTDGDEIELTYKS